MNLKITPGEQDTLKACLDHCTQRIDNRLYYEGPAAIDKFALNLTRRKIQLLRRKLWGDPPKETK